MPRRRTSRATQRKIASKRIISLLRSAEAELASHPERSSRYVEIARSISMRCKVRIPREWRRRICRRCSSLLSPGTTSRIRLRNSQLNVTCLNCGMVHRYPFDEKRST